MFSFPCFSLLIFSTGFHSFANVLAVPALPLDCQGEGDGSADRCRIKRSPSDAFQYPRRAAFRGPNGASLFPTTRTALSPPVAFMEHT